MRKYFILILLLFSVLASAQRGTIRGSVFDDGTGESLVGVSVLIKGTLRGCITDLDGKFSLDIEPGSYDVQISYISYQTITIEDVIVKSGEVKLLNELRMKESSLELGEVVVRAEMVRTTEAAVNTLKMKSAVIMDGISASKMQLTGDGTAVEAAKRVTGVSIEGGKYVYVRGLGDRYSKTTLNHIDIPGLDPDRNSLQMDIFPTNLIDNIMAHKNFTADMPADFTGGIMNVETKDFPDKRMMSLSLSASFNPDMHFNSSYLGYDGGGTDFLGFDDGTRKLPARAALPNVPTPISGASTEEVNNFIRSFSNELAAERVSSLMDYSFGFSYGDQKTLDRTGEQDNAPKLGYIVSLSYKSDQKYYSQVENNEYQRYIDPELNELRYASLQKGEIGEKNVLLGMLAGVAYKTNTTKLRFTLLALQNGESRAGRFTILNDGQAVGQSGYSAFSHNLEYNQRSLRNLLLQGTHLLKEGKWEIDWRVSPTISSSDDPDIRKTAFTETSSGSYAFSAGAGGNPTRIWRYLDETSLNARIDLTYKYDFLGNESRFKFGSSHIYKIRDYEILFFDVQFWGGTQSWPDPDPAIVLDEENLYPNKPNGIYYQSGNNNPNPNAYSSNINNTGIYVSNEFSPLPNLKTILGLRAENYVQRHTGHDQQYASGDEVNGKNLDNEKVLESLDLFPSANFIYSLTDKQNIRLTWSRTIARPSFKELSFAQILDPISNRIFNGSLFTYGDWDGQLRETRIANLDLRWELFMNNGQIVSFSAFYKTFADPIELVRIPEQQTSTEYQPRNVGDGRLYGIEFEFKKDLEFVAPSWKNLSFNGNLTVVRSSIDMTEGEFSSRTAYQKEGETVEETREMAGQAPYVINAGVNYASYKLGLDAGIFYNVKGSTLTIVGGGLFPDIYMEPFHSLNFSISKKFGEERKTSLDLKMANILDEKVRSVYRSFEATDMTYTLMNPGRSFSLGFSYRF